MAKSLRSKWRRKCRAVKRVRYGAKELERLKKVLGVDVTTKTEKDDTTDISEIAVLKTADEIKKKDEQTEGEGMDIDTTSARFNVKKLRDKNGAYPVWLHPRKIPKKSKKQKKRLKRNKGKNRNHK